MSLQDVDSGIRFGGTHWSLLQGGRSSQATNHEEDSSKLNGEHRGKYK
jgi:hypothetical protein